MDVSLENTADAVAAHLHTHQSNHLAGFGDRWLVVGYSMGGRVALALAARHPHLVQVCAECFRLLLRPCLSMASHPGLHLPTLQDPELL